jgi:hypothetical protein
MCLCIYTDFDDRIFILTNIKLVIDAMKKGHIMRASLIETDHLNGPQNEQRKVGNGTTSGVP